jgi:hypothetical protein
LIFLALHYNTKTPWKYNVGGANVFQKEMEKEREKGDGDGGGDEESH